MQSMLTARKPLQHYRSFDLRRGRLNSLIRMQTPEPKVQNSSTARSSQAREGLEDEPRLTAHSGSPRLNGSSSDVLAFWPAGDAAAMSIDKAKRVMAQTQRLMSVTPTARKNKSGRQSRRRTHPWM